MASQFYCEGCGEHFSDCECDGGTGHFAMAGGRKSSPQTTYHYLGKTAPEQDARLLKELDKVCDKHGKPWMSVYEFGEKLLYTGDLDPVYTVVWEAMNILGSGFDRRKTYSWLMAYWCFYHIGTASWIVDGMNYDPNGLLPKGWEEKYWERFEAAAASSEYPRSSERRHFRGKAAIESVAWIKEQTIESLVGEFGRAAYEQRTLDAEEVMEYVQEWKEFGPWIAFKVADMLERLDLLKVTFNPTSPIFYKSPKKGAIHLWNEHNPGLDHEREPGGVVAWAIGMLLEHLGRARTHAEEDKVGLAPPRFERPLGPAECETILCKHFSYLGGHYEIGEDVKAVRNGLLKFAKCRTAQTLLKAGKTGGLW